MAKGPFIESIKPLIASVYREYLKWKAKDIRGRVRSILRKEGKEHPELLSKSSKGWPSLSSVQNYLADLRKGAAKDDPKGKPWSIGCLVQYDIPPEALPIVLFICERHFRKFKQQLTIREVLWMARLYKIFGIDDPIALKDFASIYASYEWLDWVSGDPPRPTYTRDIDLSIIQYMATRIATATKEDELGEYYTYIATHPFLFRSLQALAKESKEELEGKLRNKDYMLCSKLTEEEAQDERQHKAKKQR